mmetsp:Transcript_152906/g.388482  ORF Transcript_152906/g.388482 Transcript_152906/m.388482 type:complete len:135 (-) Transcript_152906:66-470(-)
MAASMLEQRAVDLVCDCCIEMLRIKDNSVRPSAVSLDCSTHGPIVGKLRTAMVPMDATPTSGLKLPISRRRQWIEEKLSCSDDESTVASEGDKDPAMLTKEDATKAGAAIPCSETRRRRRHRLRRWVARMLKIT